MNILFLCHRMPYPPNKGDKIRSFHMLRHMARNHAVHAAFLVDDARDLQHLDVLRQYCAGLDHAVVNPRLKKLLALPQLLGSKPLSVPYFHDAGLQRAVDARLAQGDIQAVVCFSSPMAEYVLRSETLRQGRVPRPRLVMDFVDVDSDKWRLYAEVAKFPQNWIYGREARTLAAYDCMVGRGFDASVFVSAAEVALFAGMCPQARCVAMANGVDWQYFGDQDVPAAQLPGSPRLVFLGAMDYFPNEDGVAHFVAEVWPQVRARCPEAGFWIVGSKPTERVQALGREPGVTVTGFVQDVRPYLRGADIFVAPLRIARGVQNKVLESMAAGLPVVTRPEAIQGAPELGQVARVADSPQAMAAAVLELAADAGLRAELGRQGQQLVRDRFDWETNLAVLDGLLTTH